jgi:Fe2+ transport system protein FeoA
MAESLESPGGGGRGRAPAPVAEPRLERLSDQAPGRVVRLRRRDLSEGEASLLAAMGLSVGCRLVVRASGDPCIVEVRSTRIGLARAVAERLLVHGEPPVQP